MCKRVLIVGLLLVLFAAFLSPSTVLAQPTGDTTIQGEVGENLYLSPPSGFCFESLTPGSDATVGPKSMKVTSNKSGWFLTVQASTGGGYMTRSDSHHLIGPLQIKGGGVTSYTPLTSRVILVNGDGAAGTDVPVNNLYFQQHVDSNEEAGLYSITVTFTVSSSLP
jgi:hypothetical protein